MSGPDSNRASAALYVSLPEWPALTEGCNPGCIMLRSQNLVAYYVRHAVPSSRFAARYAA